MTNMTHDNQGCTSELVVRYLQQQIDGAKASGSEGVPKAGILAFIRNFPCPEDSVAFASTVMAGLVDSI